MRARAGATHKWAFKARFRARAFGWKSQPALTRVREAVAEITGADVSAAYSTTLAVATALGESDAVKQRIRKMATSEALGERFVNKILARELQS